MDDGERCVWLRRRWSPRVAIPGNFCVNAKLRNGANTLGSTVVVIKAPVVLVKPLSGEIWGNATTHPNVYLVFSCMSPKGSNKQNNRHLFSLE